MSNQEDIASLLPADDPLRGRIEAGTIDVEERGGTDAIFDWLKAVGMGASGMAGIADPWLGEEWRRERAILAHDAPFAEELGEAIGFFLPFGAISKGLKGLGMGRGFLRAIAAGGALGAAREVSPRIQEGGLLPGETAGGAVSDIAAGATREAGLMGAFGLGHKALGLGGQLARRVLPDPLLRPLGTRIGTLAVGATQPAFLFGAAQAAAGAGPEEVLRGMAVGGVLGLTGIGRWKEVTPRDVQLSVAIAEAHQAGVKPGEPGFAQFLKSRIRTGARNLTAEEMEFARTRWEGIEAESLLSSLAKYEGDLFGMQPEGYARRITEVQSGLAQANTLLRQVDSMRPKRPGGKKTREFREWETSRKGVTRKIKDLEKELNELHLARRQDEDAYYDSLRRIQRIDPDRAVQGITHGRIVAEGVWGPEKQTAVARERVRAERARREVGGLGVAAVEGQKILEAERAAMPPALPAPREGPGVPVGKVQPEKAMTKKARMERRAKSLRGIAARREAREEEAGMEARAAEIRRRGEMERLREQAVLALPGPVERLPEAQARPAKVGRSVMSPHQAGLKRIANLEEAKAFQKLAKMRDLRPGDPLRIRKVRGAWSVGWDGPRRWHEVAAFRHRYMAERLARQGANRALDFRDRVLKRADITDIVGPDPGEAVLFHAGISTGDLVTAAKSLRSFMDRFFYKERLRRGAVTPDEVARTRASRQQAAESSIKTAPSRQDFPLVDLKATPLQKIRIIWKNAANQEELGDPEKGLYRTFSKIWKPMDDGHRAVSVEAPKIERKVRGIIERGGLYKMNRMELEQVANFTENPDAIPKGPEGARIRRAVQAMRESFDFLFDHFEVRHRRQNYFPHLQNEFSRIQRSLDNESLLDTDPFFQKHRVGALDDLMRDPIRALQIYIRAGLKAKHLAGPVKTARDQIRFVEKNYADSNWVQYWDTWTTRIMGRPTSGQAATSTMFNNFAALASRVFPESSYWARAARDPFYADRWSRMVTTLGYVTHIGLKPVAAIRNLSQFNLALSELGETNVFGAMAGLNRLGNGSTVKGYMALLKMLKDRGIITEYAPSLWEDNPLMASRLGQKAKDISNMSMALFQGADTYNRVMTYQTAKVVWDKSWAKYGTRLQGGDQGALKSFLYETKLEGKRAWGDKKKPIYRQPKAVRDMIINKIREGDIDGAQFEYSRHFVNKWQFLYGKTGTPLSMQTPVGRVIGQFMTWPINYVGTGLQHAGNIAKGDLGAAMPFIKWAVTANLLMIGADSLLGIDVSGFFFGQNHLRQFTNPVTGRETLWSPSPPTSAIHASFGPYAQIYWDTMQAGLATISGSDYDQEVYYGKLKKHFGGNIFEIFAPTGLESAYAGLSGLVMGGDLRDRETGELISHADWWDHLSTMLGFKLSEQVHANLETKRLLEPTREEEKRRELVSRDAQKRASELGVLKQMTEPMLRRWLMIHYPGEKWLWSSRQRTRSMLNRLQTPAGERKRQRAEQRFRSRFGIDAFSVSSGLRGISS